MFDSPKMQGISELDHSVPASKVETSSALGVVRGYL